MWEKDGKIIAYAAIEESYKYVTINILSLNKIPRGRKMPYEKYAQLENAVKVLADKHSLKYCDNIAYNCINHSLNYLLQSNSKLLIITIKGNKIDYYISVLQREDDKISRMIPKGCDQKIINRKKFASINNALTEIFDELDEID